MRERASQPGIYRSRSTDGVSFQCNASVAGGVAKYGAVRHRVEHRRRSLECGHEVTQYLAVHELPRAILRRQNTAKPQRRVQSTLNLIALIVKSVAIWDASAMR
jgi:hypothetical protein